MQTLLLSWQSLIAAVGGALLTILGVWLTNKSNFKQLKLRLEHDEEQLKLRLEQENKLLASKDNIELNYFKTTEDAKDYIGSLDSAIWEILRFTPSQYNKEHHVQYSDLSHKTSHGIIGQEFDNVVITVDNYFYYDENGQLKYKGGTYYDATKMLFQNVTRTRKKLNIIIINNSGLLDRCLSILSDYIPS